MSAPATEAAEQEQGPMTPNEAREREQLERHEREAPARADSSEPGAWVAELEAHIWAMRAESLATMAQLAANGQLHTMLAEQPQAKPEAVRRRGRPQAIQGGVTRVPLKGVLMPMGGLLAMLFGLEDPVSSFRNALHTALSDPEVGAVIMDVDSPGGVVDNIPETAAVIRQARGQGKPIVAVTNTLAASAAYWLAAQADEVVVTPSGMAGSIGVYQMHRDMSGMMELMGVKTTLISAGKFKTEGNPFEPLSDEAREHIQGDVDYYYDLFVKDVAAGRGAKVGDVRSGYGEGRVLTAKSAVEAGLADRIETIDETHLRLARRNRGGVQRASAEAEAGAESSQTEAEAEQAGVAEDNNPRHSAEDLDRIWDGIEAGLFDKHTDDRGGH